MECERIVEKSGREGCVKRVVGVGESRSERKKVQNKARCQRKGGMYGENEELYSWERMEGRERYKARRKESCVTNGREKPRVESKADDRDEKRTYKVIYIRRGKWEVERKLLKK